MIRTILSASILFLIFLPGFHASPVGIQNGEPVIGRVSFGSSITQEGLLIGQERSFSEISQIYFRFSYLGMVNGSEIRYVLARNGNGEETMTDVWQHGREGMITKRFSKTNKSCFPEGNYTLDIQMDDRTLNQSFFQIGSIQMNRQVKQNGKSEQIHSDLIPAFEIIAGSSSPYLRELAAFTLSSGIPIQVTDEDSGMIAVYQYKPGSSDLGTITCSKTKMAEYQNDEIASTLAHELVHARQHALLGESFRGCTIENEFDAYLTELHFMEISGQDDLLKQKWGGVYTPAGLLDHGLLWKVLSSVYDHCPSF